MSPIGPTQSAMAFEAYSRIANERADQLRAQQAARAVKASQNARVRERSIGFSLGKFAVDFTTRDLEIDADDIAAGTNQQRRESFDAELEAAAIIQTATTPRPDTQSATTEPDTTNLTRHKALQAYAEASLTMNIPGKRFGSV